MKRMMRCYELLKIYGMPIDYTKYSKDWKLRSRFIRFFRAKNRCEVCGAENYKPHPITGNKVVLTVAHLDHDINNNSFFNLKAMCQRCHLRYDAKHHAETRRKKRIDKRQTVTVAVWWRTGLNNKKLSIYDKANRYL